MGLANPLTVFYSWQSDTPSQTNRTFIEKALEHAIGRLRVAATLDPALRELPVVLDKDTAGVAGSPPIVDTILRKIDNASVFVADLTFVGKSVLNLDKSSSKDRLFPNPNVLIEYGYALRHHSHAALVAVMNTACGEPDGESLPFDLRHLRRPITYHLADPSDSNKAQEFEKLVRKLTDALGLILRNRPAPGVAVEAFSRAKSTKSIAWFFERAENLAPESWKGEEVQITEIPDEGTIYVRVHPVIAVPALESEMEATNLARKGNLQPMGYVSGYNVSRNEFGAIVYPRPDNGRLFNFTQLFLSREIWGVDAHIASKGLSQAYSKGKAFLVSNEVEETFVETVQNYVTFAEKSLRMPLPLKIEAGITKIKGYQIGVQSGLRGSMLQDAVQRVRQLSNYTIPAYEFLDPFFNQLWAKFGVSRPKERLAALKHRFAK